MRGSRSLLIYRATLDTLSLLSTVIFCCSTEKGKDGTRAARPRQHETNRDYRSQELRVMELLPPSYFIQLLSCL